MKRKYLYIEINEGDLYVYADDRKWRGKLVKLSDMDSDAWIMSLRKKKKRFRIPLSEFCS